MPLFKDGAQIEQVRACFRKQTIAGEAARDIKPGNFDGRFDEWDKPMVPQLDSTIGSIPQLSPELNLIVGSSCGTTP